MANAFSLTGDYHVNEVIGPATHIRSSRRKHMLEAPIWRVKWPTAPSFQRIWRLGDYTLCLLEAPRWMFDGSTRQVFRESWRLEEYLLTFGFCTGPGCEEDIDRCGVTLLNKHHYVDLFKNQQNLFCIGIHFVAYVSKFGDDPSQNTKYHFHPFRLKCSFLGACIFFIS